MTTISAEREQENLPERGDPLWGLARLALGGLSESAKIALVRCEGRRTYSRSISPVRELREVRLVEQHCWSPTCLGRCVVELMCR